MGSDGYDRVWSDAQAAAEDLRAALRQMEAVLPSLSGGLPAAMSGTPLPTLAEDRINFAQADLDAINSTELIAVSNAEMVLLIERLRGSLNDTIRLRGGAPRQQAVLTRAEESNLAVMRHIDLTRVAVQLRNALSELIAALRAGS